MKNSEEKTLVKNTIDDGENPNLSDVLMSDFNASPESLVNFSAFSKEKNAVEKIIWTSSDLGDDSQGKYYYKNLRMKCADVYLRYT